MAELTHFDEHGGSRMVDTSAKPETLREAKASGILRMQPATAALIADRKLAKGDVLEVARLAGIMAAKRTADLIPLCHPLPLTSVRLDLSFVDSTTLRVEATTRVVARTGVEMEALDRGKLPSLSDGLRYVQSRRSHHDYRTNSPRRKERRSKRGIQSH